MGSIDDIKSTLTQSALDALCEKFHIPDIVHPELPSRNNRIRNSSTRKISVYTRFFDFANYWIPLSQFLVDVLEYFQINLSQLSVIAATKDQYFSFQTHPSPLEPQESSPLNNPSSANTTYGPLTTEEKVQKKNDMKARSMLLMALPYEHLITFNQYKDAKTLFAAIQTRFGGNKATKKTQKTLLKQITNVVNTAYGVSTANTQVSPASTQVSTASTQVSTANLCDDTVYAFLASQPNGSQLVHEDLEQIHEDDLEEMDLKWQLALLSMRTRSSRRTVNVEETSSKAMVAIDGAGFDWSYMADDEVPTNMALMAFSDS
ncbi:hypothetical protein Tco_1483258 [Tanacetum coccineum]